MIRHEQREVAEGTRDTAKREGETAGGNLLMMSKQKMDGRLAGIWVWDAGSCRRAGMQVHKREMGVQSARGKEKTANGVG